MRLLILTFFLLLLTGCAELQYYGHAVVGQLEVVSQRRPIAEVVADPITSDKTRQQLIYIEKAHDYAIDELILPDSDSFRSYSDVGRRYVLWNVFATPTLSLTPKKWCYLFVGCLSYRSYFNHDYAKQVAVELEDKGWDVYIAPSPAYSTRGLFSDPIYSPVLRYENTTIAGILFHELAHEKVFFNNDSQANESFAMTVQFEGVRRWLAKQNKAESYDSYYLSQQRDDEFVAMLLAHRDRLEKLYTSDKPLMEKLAAKRRTFNQIKRDYEKLKISWNGYSGFDGWFNRPMNNAVLAPIGTYHGDVPAFSQLLLENNNSLVDFYQAAESLAAQDAKVRRKKLNSLMSRAEKK